MRSKEEIKEYITENHIVPNILSIFLAKFEYEEAKEYLRDDVTEEAFKDQIIKTDDGVTKLVSVLKNSISSLMIGICNDLLVPQASVGSFVDKVRFLKAFLWFNGDEEVIKKLTFEKIDTQNLFDLSENLLSLKGGYNLSDFKKYMIDVERILSMKYELIHKMGSKVISKKLLSYIPDDFEKKVGKKSTYWFKKLEGDNERLILKEYSGKLEGDPDAKKKPAHLKRKTRKPSKAQRKEVKVAKKK